MRPGLRYSSKPASARPVFWMCGLVIARSSPSPPASSARRRHLPDHCRLRLFADDRRPLAAAALPLLPLPFHLLRLLGDLVDRLADRDFPRRRVADAVQEFLAAAVHGDVGAPDVL